MRVTSTLRPPAPEARATSRSGAAPGVLPVRIAGLGVRLGEEVVTNADWQRQLDTDDHWIRSRTGIERRHHVSVGRATADLAREAGQAALEDAGIAGADLAAVVVATTTPDQPLPSTATAVAAALGSDAAAFDLHAACAGFVYGLRVAAGLVTAGRPVLLIGADTMSRVIDPTDRSTAVLFGDGAGAVVLTGATGGTLGPFDLGSDGAERRILEIPAGGSRRPASHTSVADGAHHLRMLGSEVYRHAVAHMTESSQAVLDEAGLAVGDVDLFVGHQANARILDAVARRLGVDEDRIQLSVADHGNTSAASIPLALQDARAAGRLHPGDRVLLTAFGAGLVWGSCLLTWTPNDGGTTRG